MVEMASRTFEPVAQVETTEMAGLYAHLVHPLELGDYLTWNGLQTPYRIIDVLGTKSSPGGIGRYMKQFVAENRERSNGATFRVTFEEGTSERPELGLSSRGSRCYVQPQVDDRDGTNSFWGRSIPVESMTLLERSGDA